MNRIEFLEMDPYSVPQADKESFYRKELKKMTEDHRKACAAYDDICNGLGEDAPYLPVALFKDIDLVSVPDEQIIRKITSSGTTGQQVSRIYLDADTSAAQQRALCSITGDYIGTKRIPMLIIDSPDVLRDRRKFTARGAGILGFSMMASKRIYALDENMRIDYASLEQFQQLAKEGPTFAFGFTYMIWEYLYGGLKADAKTVDLAGCHLIHGGGWKKLQDKKVSDEVFRSGLQETCGIDSVSDYYGMAEQTGSIFMQCPEGHLHASIYSDISVLHPEDFSPCRTGEWGLIALESLLPESYPGHRLLTEDWGRILGIDDCPCGRKGKYFEISGRISKAEVRGCSDTFEGAAKATGTPGDIDAEGAMQVLAGAYPPSETIRNAFDDTVMEFLAELSELFMKEPMYRQYPELYALGFWCRHAHMEKIRSGYADSEDRRGKGLTLHIAPSNMPTMFAYSWIASLLAGNPNIVRVSGRSSEITEVAIQGISKILDRPAFALLKQQNAFVTFPRGDETLEEISSQAKARIVWGGDGTVEHICSIPKGADCVDVTFPDKYSVALFRTEDFRKMDDQELGHFAHMFYNDTYGADQNACSSPKTIFWLTDGASDSEEIRNRWWDAFAKEASTYDLQPWIATEKYRILCRMYATQKNLGAAKRWGNRLYVVPVPNDGRKLTDLEARFGMFYEMQIGSLNELAGYMEARIQTIVSSGDNQKDIYEHMRRADCAGVDRVVCAGEALDFNTVWDRKDLIALLSCTFLNETMNTKTE
ncbi:MAG: hypothetical protein K6B42_06885 [Clostridia bacterium]|nr:hypothetical protein [Clostridia bacterium]